MRINRYIAQATGLSRRAADAAISAKAVTINGESATLGTNVHHGDQVHLKGKLIKPPVLTQTILLNKPVGFVCSRNGQGSQTIYDLLPKDLHHLKPVGRLDKDSSGILLMTNDGQLAHKLAHPGFRKDKTYRVRLNRPLQPADQLKIGQGVQLTEGLSALELKQLKSPMEWQVTMHEGRNRQIRRTFEAVGYTVSKLERTEFGPYKLQQLAKQKYIIL